MDTKRKEFLKILGQNVHRLRTEQKISQTELAKRCGYESNNSRSTISKIEKGINDVSASQLKQIATALGVSVAELTKNTTNDQEILICNLIKECYGTGAYKLIQKYLQLDSYDQGQVQGCINTLLNNEKYSIKKESKNA